MRFGNASRARTWSGMADIPASYDGVESNAFAATCRPACTVFRKSGMGAKAANEEIAPLVIYGDSRGHAL